MDLGARLAYQEAVHERTETVLASLKPDASGELLDPVRLDGLVVAPDGFGARAATRHRADRVRMLRRQVPRGWFLSQATLIPPTLHVGEVRTIASRRGWRGV